MTVAEKIADKMINFNQFCEMAEQVLNMVMDVRQPEYVKETVWLLEGEYSTYKKQVMEAIEEMYTPEQQESLLNFYESNPWYIEKATEMSQVLGFKGIAIGKKIADQVMQNLEERGDADKIFND
jgi:hypothetical protein